MSWCAAKPSGVEAERERSRGGAEAERGATNEARWNLRGTSGGIGLREERRKTRESPPFPHLFVKLRRVLPTSSPGPCGIRGTNSEKVGGTGSPLFHTGKRTEGALSRQGCRDFLPRLLYWGGSERLRRERRHNGGFFSYANNRGRAAGGAPSLGEGVSL